MKYKATLRIPGKKEYSYIEVDVEDTTEGILEAFHGFIGLVQGGSGLPEKAFSDFVDRYLTGETNHIEEYQKMDDRQKETIQIIKRSLARLKARGLLAENNE